VDYQREKTEEEVKYKGNLRKIKILLRGLKVTVPEVEGEHTLRDP